MGNASPICAARRSARRHGVYFAVTAMIPSASSLLALVLCLPQQGVNLRNRAAGPAMPVLPRASELAREGPLRLLELGSAAIEAGDPGKALASYRAILLQRELSAELRWQAKLGLGKSWLVLGQGGTAKAYANELLRTRPSAASAWALLVRAVLSTGEFQLALELSRRAFRVFGGLSTELRSAHASALFRNQELRAAEAEYRRLLRQEPRNNEALIRLGTGLLSPRTARRDETIDHAALLGRKGQFNKAISALLAFLGANPEHPVALRLTGELQLSQLRAKSPLVREAFMSTYWALLDEVRQPLLDLPAFFPKVAVLGPDRVAMLRRSSLPFEKKIARVGLAGGSHDILLEWERSTDAEERRWLRGTLTFDGRGWDDVRGVGGLNAATGVEALDEAQGGGFQTVIHEIAHQIHMHAMSEKDKRKLTKLYELAEQEGCALDYYAAANEAEYFAQGVEAYLSFMKAAGQPVTHGHTSFELLRRDPRLFGFVAEILDWDPLESAARGRILKLAFRAALRVGRTEDARLIFEMLPGTERTGERRQALRRCRLHFRGI